METRSPAIIVFKAMAAASLHPDFCMPEPLPERPPGAPIDWKKKQGGRYTKISKRESPRYTKGGRKLKRKKQSR